jgi:hypothetical protein
MEKFFARHPQALWFGWVKSGAAARGWNAKKERYFAGSWFGGGVRRFAGLGWRLGFLFAVDQGLQVETRTGAVIGRERPEAFQGRLGYETEAAQVGLLVFGKAVWILSQDGLETGIGFGLTWWGKMRKVCG